MSESAQQSTPTAKRVRWRRALAGSAAFILAVAVALLTGIPQRVTVEYAMQRALGADVRVTGLSLTPRVRIAQLRLADASGTDASPMILRDVDLRYTYHRGQGLTIPELHIGAVKLDLRRHADESTNYAFIERMLRPKPDSRESFDADRYLPRSFRIGDLSVKLDAPEGGLDLEGLQVDAEIDSLLSLDVLLHGDDVHGSVRVPEETEARPVAGTVNVQILQNMANTGVTVAVSLENIATLDGKANIIRALGTTAAQLQFADARFLNDTWATLVPGPLRFDALDLSGTSVALITSPGATWTAKADIQFDGQNIRYGEPGHEWYEGNLKVSGNYDGERGQFEALLNKGQRLAVMAEGEPAKAHVAATLIDWGRADLEDALPKDWRPLLDNLPHLSQIAASAEIRTDLPAYTLNASADPIFTNEAGDNERFSLRINGGGSTNDKDRDLFHGDLDATLGEGTVHSSVDADTAQLYTANVSLKTMALSAMTALLRLNALPDNVRAIVSGAVDVTHGSKGVSAGLDLKLAPATLGPVAIPDDPPLTIAGTLAGTDAMDAVKSNLLALRFTDDAAIEVKDFQLTFTPFTITGHATGKIDFDYVGPTIGMPSVVGALTVDMPLRYADGAIESTFRCEGDGFGYGSWAGPYGTSVVLTGQGRYDTQSAAITIDNASGNWGDGTTFASSSLNIGLNPLSVSGPFSMDTNLSPFVDLRFLNAAEGHATAKGTLAYGTDQVTAIDYDLAASSLTLRDAVAAFGGLTSSGSMAYGDTFNGRAGFAAADAAAAGAMLHNPQGSATIENGVAQATGVHASLYGGNVTFDVAVNVLDVDAGGRLDAHLENIDLDRFTQEYEPPSVTLTGIANGDAMLAWNKDALRELRVDLASDQGFSLNREIIQDLLLQSLTAEVTGMKKLNKQIEKETIGKAAQRPFDSASVSLSLEGDTYEDQRLVGPIALKSKMLNLSIDLGVDLRAIADALDLQQQARLGEGDTISAEPVQWKLPDTSPKLKSNNPDEDSSSTAKEEEP